MNVQSKEGIINTLGQNGSAAELVDCRTSSFENYIEEGIKTTVYALINNGIMTTSSCQGHIGKRENRSVTIQIEEEYVPFFKKIVWEINQETTNEIKYCILDVGCIDVYEGEFVKPKKEERENKNEYIYINRLNEFMSAKTSIIKPVYDSMVSRLGYKLGEMYDEIVSDVRMSQNLKSFISECINSKPERVIEILLFLALFDAYDRDEEFYNEFESHFLLENDSIITKPQNLVEGIVESRGGENGNNGVKSLNPMMLQRLMRTKVSPESMHVCDLSVELVYSDHRWWALIWLE